MNTLTWIFQILLILIFLLFGLQKLLMSQADLLAFGMLWVEDFQPWQIKTIAALEVLAALGMFLPYFIKKIPKIIVAISSAGLALTMIGAIFTHIVRNDLIISIVLTSFFFLMGIFVAVMRYKEYK